jgi:hypothetical protein
MYVVMLCSKSVEHRITEASSFPYIDMSPECKQNEVVNLIIKSKLDSNRSVCHIFICYSVTLIAAASSASEMLLNRLLTSVFHVMVFTVGIDELRSTRNAERLKRDLRVRS